MIPRGVQRVVRSSVLAAGTLALAGCMTPQTQQGAAQAEASQPAAATFSDATAIFDRICLGTAPDFVAARQRMRDLGLTRTLSGGAQGRPDGSVSAKIRVAEAETGNRLERCSVVWRSADGSDVAARVDQLLAAGGITTKPRTQARLGSRTVDIWKFDYDGRRARLIFAPGAGQLLPGLFLDVAPAQATA